MLTGIEYPLCERRHIVATEPASYPAQFDVDYPERLDRVSTLFRIIMIIPIAIVIGLLTGGSETVTIVSESGEQVSESAGRGVAASLALATALMIVFRQRYPRWWFDFAHELSRFSARVVAYLLLLTDQYPSTEDEQSVHLQLDYPDAKNDLNRWLPLVKWLLAIPHYLVLFILSIGVVLAVLVAWLAILVTGRYPRALFNYVVGTGRWALRVYAYAFLLITDRYPPFSMR